MTNNWIVHYKDIGYMKVIEALCRGVGKKNVHTGVGYAPRVGMKRLNQSKR